MIVFNCPGCAQSLQVRDEQAARQVECPRCHRLLYVPSAPAPTSIAASANPRGRVSDPPTVQTPSLDHGPATIRTDSALPTLNGVLPNVMVPGYEILGELGRGGMGVVYKARHIHLKRLVALKMILGGGHAGETQLARFRIEAEAVARLQHPGIVQIYEVGEHNGLPYFALEFCSGGSLASKLNGTPLPPREAAQVVEQVARAMQVAHAQGVIHRDLKPANVLLATEPEAQARENLACASGSKLHPKITDFGLAKKLDDEQGQTATGAVMGTPSYMAPEQAQGKVKELGPAADIYALGAMLYEVLTGRPPFRGATPMDTLIQAMADEPVPPSSLQSKVPTDLETICLKCLEKSPERRYATAGELAEELRRYQAGEPILARPISVWRRGAKWAWRKPAAAALIAVSSLAAVTLLAALLISNQLVRQKQKATETALRSEQEARQELQRAQGETTAALKEKTDALQRELQIAYARRIALAERERLANNPVAADRILDECPEELRKWEWHYLKRQCHVNLLTLELPGLVNAACFTPDGSRIVTASVKGSTSAITVWDAASGRELSSFQEPASSPTCIALSPDGKTLALAASSNVPILRTWDLETGKQKVSFPGSRNIHGLAFSKDNKQLASASDDGIKVWDADTGRELRSLQGSFASVAFHPDGKRLASAGDDRTVRLWQLDTGQALFTWTGKANPPKSVMFSSDGRRLFAGGMDSEVKILDPATGRESFHFSGESSLSMGRIALRRNGLELAGVSGDTTVKTWETVTGRNLHTFRGHNGPPLGVNYSADGLRLVSFTYQQVKVWKADPPPVAQLMPQWGRDPRPSLDGKYLASSGAPVVAPGGRSIATAVVLDLDTGKEVFTSQTGALLAYSPDGKYLATGEGMTIHIWDIANRKELHAIHHPNPSTAFVLFQPSGKQYVVCSDAVRDLATGKVIRTEPAQAAAYSSDGQHLALAVGQTLKLAEAATGKEIYQARRSYTINQVLFSPDGRLLALANSSAATEIADAASGKQLQLFHGDDGPLVLKPQLLFTPDSKRLAWRDSNHVVRIGSVADHKVTTIQQRAPVACLSFTPDGNRLVTCSAHVGLPQEVKFWDAGSGQEIFTLPEHDATAALFGPDGRLITATPLRIWDAAPLSEQR